MTRTRIRRRVAHSFTPALPTALLALLLGAGVAQAQPTAAADTIRAGRFDAGRMWTFEYAPTDYFSQTYDFKADAAWFERARLASLRIPGCSAAFVSPNGLVVTNHHCARGSIVNVQRAGESLLDDGFYAPTNADERRVPNYYVDQLIAVEDVSDEVFRVLDAAPEGQDRQRVRQEAFAGVRERLQQKHAASAAGGEIVVQTVALYHGGRYSAYVFRRFSDVRLVAAAEEQVAFFGGDPDNFTYPRYDLDFAFLRVYGTNGKPISSKSYFTFSREGAQPGEPVFVIGSPGPTSRLLTMAQLEYHRDVQLPASVDFLRSRHGAMQQYYEQQRPGAAEASALRNAMFSLSNSLKSIGGQLGALRDPLVMAKRADAERTFRSAVQARPEIAERWGGVFDQLAEVQNEKRRLARQVGAFTSLGHATAESALLRRSILARRLRQQPGDSAALAQIARIRNNPEALERRLLTARLEDLQRSLGATDPVVVAALGGRTPEQAAQAILTASALTDSARTAQGLAAGLAANDPGVALAQAILPGYDTYLAELQRLQAREAELNEQLGRARFEVFGTAVPPDATSSPRISDGIVRGYEFNGTVAPPHTTFFGMYDRYYAFGADTPWDLPARWLPAPAALDLGTPLNFVSTADTFGGNSGSPAVTRNLELVGLNFDRNIEGLSRSYIYLPERGQRNVMVDVRAIRESLDDVYDADRIVLELATGRMYETERAADAVKR